jgi:mannan endo-1,4-beta-mannosidase
MKTNTASLPKNFKQKRSRIPFLILLLSASFSHCDWSYAAQIPSDPNASSKTRAVLNYLAALPTRATNRIISGQALWGGSWAREPKALYAATGQHVGFIEADYGPSGYSPPRSASIEEANNLMIDHWNKGGLVGACSHTFNPKTGGNYRDLNFSDTDMVALITPGNAINARWIAELNRVAAMLQSLQAKGVVFIWRPLHEMNGGWFWWCAKEPEKFKAVWRHMHNYFTNTKGLHNLLWAWAPVRQRGETSDYTRYYPGAQFVDVVGIDLYADDFTSANDGMINGYNQLLGLNKVFAITEFGPYGGELPPYNYYDYMRFLNQVKSTLPRAAYWTSWSGPWSPVGQLNANALLNDSWVANRDEIHLSTLLPSMPTNTPPTISLTSLANGSIFTAPATITVSANATDSNGTVSKVEFLRNGVVIGTDTASPYSGIMSDLAADSYTLAVRATDNAGAVTTSGTIDITVKAPTAGNTPPSVSLTSPANGSIFTAPATIIVSATASDSNGTVSKVEFLRNGVVIGTDTASPYSWIMSNLAAGSYTLAVRATDNAGAVKTSGTVGITVKATTAMSASLTFTAATDFSNTQGARGWSYLDSTGSLLVYDPVIRAWKGAEAYLFIWADGAHPGASRDVIRRWTAPQAGTISITGNVRDLSAGGGDGVIAIIRKNGVELKLIAIANGNATGVNFSVPTSVAAGATIDFVINRISTNWYDSTVFNPTIVLTPANIPTTSG